MPPKEITMPEPFKVAVLIGSLRKQSFNRRTAQAMTSLAQASLSLETIDIGQLPLYDQDLDDENRPPQAWTDFRASINRHEAVLFITPEYNRSVPGVLKNAIDVGSRPYGKSVWDKKPAGVISVSPGAIGGFGANHHLRQSLVFLNMPVMQQPEAYVGNAASLFTDDGGFVDKSKEFFQNFVTSFARWIDLHKAGRAASIG
jgi:chromate reductase, NAD(P)H dehydrogenase (quinone)